MLFEVLKFYIYIYMNIYIKFRKVGVKNFRGLCEAIFTKFAWQEGRPLLF